VTGEPIEITEPDHNGMLRPDQNKQKTPEEHSQQKAVVMAEEQDSQSGDKNHVSAIKEILHSRDGKIVGIARGDMRRLFLEDCEDFIHWGKNVTSYTLTPTGVIANFSDGTSSIEGEMLVGGEGIYSKIAKQVSGGKLKVFDTGVRGIHGQAPTAAFKGLGEGVWRIVDDESPRGRVFGITNVRPNDMDDSNVIFGWTMCAVPGVIEAPGGDWTLIGEAAASLAKELSKNWALKVRRLMDDMIEEDAAFWKFTCSSPSGVPVWENEKRVTLVGDAVHSMTPAGGNGANTAVRDSELLGRLIVEAGGWKEGLTREYERQMRVYGSQAVKLSYEQARAEFGIVIDEESSLTV
jgi:2-polyprenyl-6-methoxyphenol hydroxylase-like FAD-dependent oxidoreductase